jgi:hypothetical protein
MGWRDARARSFVTAAARGLTFRTQRECVMSNIRVLAGISMRCVLNTACPSGPANQSIPESARDELTPKPKIGVVPLPWTG